jgi:hypothetical protein
MKLPRFTAAMSVCAAVLTAAGPAAPPPVAQKFLSLFEQLRTSASTKKQVSFLMTDTEINEYLAYSMKVTPRPGLDSARVKVFDHNYLSTLALIDFDAVERWKPGTIPFLLRPVLSGKKSIWVDVRFNVQNGAATFRVEKAYFQNIPIPAIVVEKVIQLAAARQPEKYDTTKPVPLPFGLKNLWTKGNAVGGQT